MSARTTRYLAGCTGAVLLAVSTGTIQAHHSITMFDMTPVRVAGTIVSFDAVNPHSYLYVDGTTAGGQVERWAIEGPAPAQLVRRGIPSDLLRPGDTIEACGFVLKEGDQEPRGYARKVEGRVMVAATLILSSGEGRIWAPYGQLHRCVGPEDKTHYQ